MAQDQNMPTNVNRRISLSDAITTETSEMKILGMFPLNYEIRRNTSTN